VFDKKFHFNETKPGLKGCPPVGWNEAFLQNGPTIGE
jgi:hypothetical protein